MSMYLGTTQINKLYAGANEVVRAYVGADEVFFTPLLLDLLSATPTGAYASWKLRDAYAGYCIKVRRASDNATQDIGFTADGVLDTAALATFCAGTDGFVVTLYDQSGNGRDLTQATAGNQPQIVSAGALITTINGLPSMQFDGTNDRLSGAAISNFLTATAYGIVALARPTAGGANDTDGSASKAVLGDQAGYWWHGYGATKFAGGHWNAGDHASRIAASYPNSYVSAHSYDGTTIKAWLNGGVSTNTAYGSGIQFTTGTMSLGRSQTGYFSGTACAALMFNAAPSLSDLNLIGAELASKGGTTWSTAT